jgi:hypothetical protein
MKFHTIGAGGSATRFAFAAGKPPLGGKICFACR